MSTPASVGILSGTLAFSQLSPSNTALRESAAPLIWRLEIQIIYFRKKKFIIGMSPE
jgi:hypothetical protein